MRDNMVTTFISTLGEIATVIGNFFTFIATSLPFSTASWFVISIMGFFVWLFVKADKNPNSPIRWEQLIVDSATSKTSPYKMGYLIGVIISTWVIITFADKGHLEVDVLGVYLTYLVGGAGFNEWLKHGKIPNRDDDSSDSGGTKAPPPPKDGT